MKSKTLLIKSATIRWLRRIPMIPITIILLLVIVATFANYLAPHKAEIGSLRDRFKPPFWQEGGSEKNILGTDHMGRDEFSRLIYGSRVTLIVGLLAVVLAGSLGTALGIISGFLGGKVDQIVMRITDTWLALPALTFAIFLAALLGPSEKNIIIVLASVYWTNYARVIRGEVLSLRERDYVNFAVVCGCSKIRIMIKHILPNVINTSVVLGTLMLGSVVITESSLSFLGIGVPPPKPAWGLMLADGRAGLLRGYWWLTVFPGSAITLVVLAANLLGDWLRERLDPQLKEF